MATGSRASQQPHGRMSASPAAAVAVAEVVLTSKTSRRSSTRSCSTSSSRCSAPDTTSLVTTVRNEEVAQRKALLSAQKGSRSTRCCSGTARWALLSECMGELGLPNDGSPNPITAAPARDRASGGAPTVAARRAASRRRCGTTARARRRTSAAPALGAAERPPAFEPQPLPRAADRRRDADGGGRLRPLGRRAGGAVLHLFGGQRAARVECWRSPRSPASRRPTSSARSSSRWRWPRSPRSHGAAAIERRRAGGPLRLQAAGGGEVEVAVTLSSFGERAPWRRRVGRARRRRRHHEALHSASAACRRRTS